MTNVISNFHPKNKNANVAKYYLKQSEQYGIDDEINEKLHKK